MQGVCLLWVGFTKFHVYADKVYNGTMKCSLKTCIVEHKQNCLLDQLEKSAVAEHVLLTIEEHSAF